MDAQYAIDLGREALTTALVLGAPLLLVALAVAFVVGVFQALTQIQDQTLAFVPKIVAVLVAAAFCLPWLVHRMVEYSQLLLGSSPFALR
jgi:flagellar biosynthetic protein FliQ